MFLGSYTWSKFLGSGADQQIGASYGYPGLISPYQRRRNKALDAQDVPHTLSLTSLYEIPMGKGHRFMGSSGVVGDKLFSGSACSPAFHSFSIRALEPATFRANSQWAAYPARCPGPTAS